MLKIDGRFREEAILSFLPAALRAKVFSVMIILFSVIASIALFTARLFPMPDAATIVKLSAPPMILFDSFPVTALKFCACCLIIKAPFFF